MSGEIHDAAQKGDLAKVKSLITNDPTLVNSRDDRQAVPLHWSAGTGRKDVTDFLLANKADVSAKDIFGGTPLHWAAAHGQKDTAELLLAHKADVNATDNSGAKPEMSKLSAEASKATYIVGGTDPTRGPMIESKLSTGEVLSIGITDGQTLVFATQKALEMFYTKTSQLKVWNAKPSLGVVYVWRADKFIPLDAAPDKGK